VPERFDLEIVLVPPPLAPCGLHVCNLLPHLIPKRLAIVVREACSVDRLPKNDLSPRAALSRAAAAARADEFLHKTPVNPHGVSILWRGPHLERPRRDLAPPLHNHVVRPAHAHGDDWNPSLRRNGSQRPPPGARSLSLISLMNNNFLNPSTLRLTS